MAKAIKKVVVKTRKSTPKSNKPQIFEKLNRFFKYVFSKKFVEDVKKKPIWSKKWAKNLGLVLLFVISFVLVDLFVQYLNNDYSAAIVNGVRVSKSEYYERLEKAYGATAVTRLIEEKLIAQGSAADGVVITDEDIQARVNDYYNENGGKDAVLAYLQSSNLTEEDLREQVRLSLLLENTLKKQITYTDEDLKKFFDEYKSYIYSDENVKFEDNKSEIEDYYISQKVEEMRSAWVSELESKAVIVNNISTKPSYGFLKTTVNIVKNLYNQIKSGLEKS